MLLLWYGTWEYPTPKWGNKASYEVLYPLPGDTDDDELEELLAMWRALEL